MVFWSPAVSLDCMLNSYSGHASFSALSTISVCSRASFDLRVPTLNVVFCGDAPCAGDATGGADAIPKSRGKIGEELGRVLAS